MKDSGIQPKRLITWRKNNAVPINRPYMPMSACEYIIVGTKKGKSPIFNADVPTVEQTPADKIIQATIVADKASTIAYTAVYNALVNFEPASSGRTAEERGVVEFQNDSNSLVFEEPSSTPINQNPSHADEVSRASTEAIKKSLSDVDKKIKAMYKPSRSNGEEITLQACVPNYIQNPLKTGKRIHPTEKPVALLQYLIALYSKLGDTILDGFAGSGSTGEAAWLLGRNSILVEQEAVFYGKLRDRLQKLTAAAANNSAPTTVAANKQLQNIGLFENFGSEELPSIIEESASLSLSENHQDVNARGSVHSVVEV